MIILGVMVGGAAGALARYVVDVAVGRRCGLRFPWGTLVINVTGSALLGFLTGLVLYHGFPDLPHAILGSGFCGGYTTFSTHALDTVKLSQGGPPGLAVGNVGANLLLSVAAAGAGMALASF